MSLILKNFNGKFYDETDGVAIGSLLATVLANFFMGHNATLWIENFYGTRPSYCRRYVDDIISVFNNSFEAKNFLIILTQDTLKLSLPWRLKLIKSFAF